MRGCRHSRSPLRTPVCSDPAATEALSERMVLTRSSVVCVADPARCSRRRLSVPHTQSQCAETIEPRAGAGASDSSPFFHCTRSVPDFAECERAVVELQRARRDHRVLALDGFDGSPADAAVLHDAERCRRIAVQETHPRVDDEDVKAVVRQHSGGLPSTASSSPVTCPLNASAVGSAGSPGRLCPAPGRPPSSC